MADHPSRAAAVTGSAAAFTAITVVAISMRCYTRAVMVKAFGLDDWLMLFATAMFVVYCSCCISGAHYGTGRHFADLAPENISTAMRFWWFCYLFYCLTMIASKLSIGYFLLRLTTQKIHKWIIYLALLMTVMTGIVFFFVTMLQCHPISFFWDKNQDGSCINIDIIIALTYLYSSFSVISDFIFALLPIFLVWRLQMDHRTKIVLIPILGMACIASSAVVIRFPYLHLLRNNDFLWDTTDIAIWSTVEQGLAITAGSLATLRPLFQMVLHTLGISSIKPSNRSGSRYGLPLSEGRKVDVSGSQNTAPKGPYVLKTFETWSDPVDNIPPEEMAQGMAGNKVHVVASGKRHSLWKSPHRDGRTESEEELKLRASADGVPMSAASSILRTPSHPPRQEKWS